MVYSFHPIPVIKRLEINGQCSKYHEAYRQPQDQLTVYSIAFAAVKIVGDAGNKRYKNAVSKKQENHAQHHKYILHIANVIIAINDIIIFM